MTHLNDQPEPPSETSARVYNERYGLPSVVTPSHSSDELDESAWSPSHYVTLSTESSPNSPRALHDGQGVRVLRREAGDGNPEIYRVEASDGVDFPVLADELDREDYSSADDREPVVTWVSNR